MKKISKKGIELFMPLKIFPFYLLIILTATGVLLFSCHSANKASPLLFQLVQNSNINFINEVHNMDSFNIINYRNFYNGGGVAIGDINNDGLPDIFFTSNMGANKLYLNKGNMHFEDISAQAGFDSIKTQWSTGVVMADVNGDGWLDIYVCNAGHMENSSLRKNQLFINNHNLHFTDSAKEYGLADSGFSTQASFFDYDNDGDLDCFIINNSPIVNTLDYANNRDLNTKKFELNSHSNEGGDHLYRNDNGHFTEVTQQAGIHGGLISLGLGVTVGDINNDGYPDIYVSNDYFERDYLYINQKNGTFKDELEQYAPHTSLASMGADIADINNDGYLDIFTTDMLPDDDYRLKTTFAFENIDVYNLKQKSGFYHQFFQNALQLNNKDGKLQDIAHYSGVSGSDWSWGSLLFDMDNDGYPDIYICNGITQDLINQDFLDFFAQNTVQNMKATGKKMDLNTLLNKIPSQPILNKAFRNLGNLKFADAGQSWGLTVPSFSNGAAYGDLDNDGDLDLVVNNENQPAFIYKNNARELNKNHYLAVSLKGKGKNTFAIGSRISVYRGNQILSREVMPSRGFQSSVDYKIVIGLGASAVIDSMVVTWPDHAVTRVSHPSVDTLLTIRQTETSTIPPPPPNSPATPLLTPVSSSFDKHQEDDYNDFHTEHNLPKMLSREGPKATVGDVNGDGLQDIYIGGATGQEGQLYLQTAEGKFIKQNQKVFGQFADLEDVAVLFFDCDHDGDLDLLVCPGGNNANSNSRQMQLRLYKNDGKGNFEFEPAAFPNTGMNTAVAIAEDFNHDGYPDLFIGSRSYPQIYGIPPSSYLFINDGNGHFTDMAATKNQDIAHIGMVTGAVWADVTGDKQKELIITGEWMAPHIFSYNGDHFIEVHSNMENLFGWWQTIATADLNGDGRTDLILGNIGENFTLHPDSTHPVKLWINDFDQNGILDKILTRNIDGRDMPVFLKHDMEIQIPSLKYQNLRHADYARKSIRELFPPGLLDSSLVKQFNYPGSIVAFNEGNGHFVIQPLPATVQLSSVNAIHCMDINHDGFTDLILGGNEFGFLPQFGRLDASMGHVLINDGKGNFTGMSPKLSGLDLPGQIRDIIEIPGKKRIRILFLQNDEYPVLYEFRSDPKK